MPSLIFLSSEFPPGPGGIGNHTIHLAQQLYHRGWDVRVFSPQDYAPQEEIEQFNRSLPFPVVRMLSKRSWMKIFLTRFRLLAGAIREQRPALLLASGRSAVFLAAVVATLFRVRMVAVGHGTEFGVPGLMQKALTRIAYQRAEAVISVSWFTAGLVDKLGIRPRVSKVIHNGADAERFQILPEEAIQEYAQRISLEDGPILLTVGSVTDRKGQEIVIRAMPEVLREIPETRYLMAGLPVEQRKLADLAEELGVASRVHFLGRLAGDDLVACMNCCDVFLMTSRTTPDGDCEGFGIAAIEAALCGKPAIVASNSGLAEAVENGVTGLVVPEGDVQATAGSVIRLLRDENLRRSLSKQARMRALAEQTWQKRGDEYDQFLHEFLVWGK